MVLESKLYNAIKASTTYFLEENVLDPDLVDPQSNGVFLIPSQVPGRTDITGYILGSQNDQGKLQWIEDPSLDLKLNDLSDVDTTGVVNGNTIVYSAATQTWIPGANGFSAGDACTFDGTTLDVLYDGVTLGLTGGNELEVLDASITNAKLVNSSITLTQTGGLTLTSPAVLGGNVNIGIDATVITTAGGQEINGTLTLDSLLLQDATTNTVELSVPGAVASYTLTLPDAQGGAGQYLVNNGSGTLTWADAPSSSVFSWKNSGRASTTAPGTLASDFENGDTIDGVVLATGDRILIKDQASGVENGIYTVNASGAPTRATDLNTGDSAASIAILIEEGTQNADAAFVCTTDAPNDIVGTDPLAFAVFSSSNLCNSAGVSGDIQLNDGSGGFKAATLSTFNYLDHATDPVLRVGVNSGTFTMEGQDGSGASSGSQININSGQGGATGNGGAININSGVGGSTSGNSGDLTLTSGTVTSGNSGDITLTTSGGAGVTQAGSISLTAGDSTVLAGGIGGAINITAGDSQSTVAGADINLTPGTTSGETILNGQVNLNGNLEQTITSLKQLDTVTDGTNMIDPVELVTDGTYAYVAALGSDSLVILDITIPTNVSIEGFLTGVANMDQPAGIVISGQYCFISATGSDSIVAFDIRDRTSPSVVDTLIDGTNLVGIKKIAINGTYIYATSPTNNRFTIVDVSDPTNMVVVSSIQDNTNLLAMQSIQVYGDSAFVVGDDLLSVVDIETPTNPTILGTLSDAVNLDGAVDLKILNGRYALVVTSSGDSIVSVDISDLTSPTFSDSVVDATNLNNPNELVLAGDLAYVSNTTGGDIAIIDISDPSSMSLLSNELTFTGPRGLIILGTSIFIVDDTNTFYSVKVPGSDLLSCEISNIKTQSLYVSHGAIINGIVDIRTSMHANTALVRNLTLQKASVTQITSTTTAVTLDSASGLINMVANSMGADSDLSFTMNNDYVKSNSIVIVNIASYDGVGSGVLPTVYVNNIANGSCDIVVVNASPVAMTADLMSISFAIF